MKNIIAKSICLAMIIVSSFSVIGCAYESICIKYEYMNILHRENADDYCLDFFINIENKTNQETFIDRGDFNIEVDGIKKDVSLLHAYEEVYYLGHISIEVEKNITIRVRTVSDLNVNNSEKNHIAIMYKNTVLVEDDVSVSHKNR